MYGSIRYEAGACFMVQKKIRVLTRIALNIVAEMPSATSNSPRSFGRVKLFSNEELNIL